MATKPDTVSKILDGALSALARSGPRKFSMSDICEHAGVARGTLYRYFKSKEEVLEALGDYVSTMLSAAVQEAIAERPEPEVRVRVVLEAMTGFWSGHPEMVLLGKLEPAFTLEYIERALGGFTPLMHNVLDPVLKDNALVAAGVTDADRIIDLILRVVFTYYYMPVDERSEREAAWDVLTALTGPISTPDSVTRKPTRKRSIAS